MNTVKKLVWLFIAILALLYCKNPSRLQHGFIRSGAAILRSQPSNMSKTIKKLMQDADIEILDIDNNENLDPAVRWFRIRSDGKTGWIQGTHLFIIKDGDQQEKIRTYKKKLIEKAYEAKYTLDYYHGVPPEMVLHSDGSFQLTINRCQGMMPVSGKYICTKDQIILYEIVADLPPQNRVVNTILSKTVIELERMKSGDLKITNDLLYDDGIEKYGMCAPNIGDVFLQMNR